LKPNIFVASLRLRNGLDLLSTRLGQFENDFDFIQRNTSETIACYVLWDERYRALFLEKLADPKKRKEQLTARYCDPFGYSLERDREGKYLFQFLLNCGYNVRQENVGIATLRKASESSSGAMTVENLVYMSKHKDRMTTKKPMKLRSEHYALLSRLRKTNENPSYRTHNSYVTVQFARADPEIITRFFDIATEDLKTDCSKCVELIDEMVQWSFFHIQRLLGRLIQSYGQKFNIEHVAKLYKDRILLPASKLFDDVVKVNNSKGLAVWFGAQLTARVPGFRRSFNSDSDIVSLMFVEDLDRFRSKLLAAAEKFSIQSVRLSHPFVSEPKQRASTDRVKAPHHEVRILNEIDFYQNNNGPLIPFKTFRRIIKKIEPSYRFERTAVWAIREATETFIVEMLRQARFCAMHHGRITIRPNDMAVTRKIFNRRVQKL